MRSLSLKDLVFGQAKSATFAAWKHHQSASTHVLSFYFNQEIEYLAEKRSDS